MSFKTESLVKLFPDAYAADDRESMLYKLLDTIGAEHMQADETVKRLLKSHWVNYAEDGALDGLGGIFGVARRRLPDGSMEPDTLFRLRLKSIVPLFTGGGTREAVLGAVRSALGLPFKLEQLELPEQYAYLIPRLESLITLIEFSPNEELLIKATEAATPGALTLDVPIVSVKEEWPEFIWQITRGAARRLRLMRIDSGQGVKSDDDLILPEGAQLLLSASSSGALQVYLDNVDVSGHFTSLDDGPAQLPLVPGYAHQWEFSSQGALFDKALFDADDTFDRPLFSIEMRWRSYEPLTFDVYVPYFLKAKVDEIKGDYPGEIFVYEGLDLSTIQAVVDQTRAAGVRGNVHFSLNFHTIHDQREAFSIEGLHQDKSSLDAREEFDISSGAMLDENHGVETTFSVGGIYDMSRFDNGFAFS